MSNFGLRSVLCLLGATLLLAVPAIAQTLQYDTGDLSNDVNVNGSTVGNIFTVPTGGTITGASAWFVRTMGTPAYSYHNLRIGDQIVGSSYNVVANRQAFTNPGVPSGFKVWSGLTDMYTGTQVFVGVNNTGYQNMAADSNTGCCGFNAAGARGAAGTGLTQGSLQTGPSGAPTGTINLANYNIVLRISGNNLPVELMTFEVAE